MIPDADGHLTTMHSHQAAGAGAGASASEVIPVMSGGRQHQMSHRRCPHPGPRPYPSLQLLAEYCGCLQEAVQPGCAATASVVLPSVPVSRPAGQKHIRHSALCWHTDMRSSEGAASHTLPDRIVF